MIKEIIHELKNHSPFTIFGAVTGIVIMLFFHNLPHDVSYKIFYVLHPAHVLLSALVTASMYSLHMRKKYRLWVLFVIGYVGSIGIATLSDSIIPFMGEVLLDLPNKEIHIGFIEKWWLINPLAFLGTTVACVRPTTKFPHSGHVLLSTWASLFHIIMALQGELNLFVSIVIFIFLFFSVWLPCCISDIVFPLLFVKGENCHHQPRQSRISTR
ncbi:MAG: hypothetical protein JXD19_08150 [Deltaproteobacteria bacterium]|nr:hypothetical protein [Deltaproteobacteria bacterium]